MIFDLFRTKHECKHTHIPIDADEAYCPDCGEYIKTKWYIVRCSCCNIKRTAHTEFGNIKPDTKFCPNCGSKEFYIQEPEKIHFTDLHYAVCRREVVKQYKESVTTIRIEKDDECSEPKLIGVSLKNNFAD